MGLIRATFGAAGSVLADQWKEYFACDSLDNDILVAKGRLRTKRNNKASTDIISNGSVISVNEGQVALIVEDGKIVEFTAEPGRFVWDSSTEPSLFTGGFFKGLVDSFKKFGERFTFAGDTGKVQRVYYVNVKEIMDNKFGTSTPMPYDDPYYKTALYLRYYGQYSFKITDPIVFYTSISGNVSEVYTREQLRSMCTDEFMTALDTALAMCSQEGFKFSQLPMKQREIARFMSDTLDDEWNVRRGMQIVSVALAKVTPDEKSRERIETFDTNVMHSAPDAMAGGLAYAQMQAMQNAAKNEAGAMTGFMGFGMAANAMGAQSQGTLIESARDMAKEKESKSTQAEEEKANTWKCECGTDNVGKFCPECGSKAPEEKTAWKCSCGAENGGKFCTECGRAAPTDIYTCSCSFESKNPFKFCPECGKKQ
ncbi:MAG: hypothetical protein GX303_02135 [Clostridiales bacterium]|nr:hypothetical protein [Clostridiales bacterium]